MKIIYLTAYFYPEKYASDGIYTSILEELAKTNEVHVITPQSCRGLSFEEYLNFCPYECKNGVHIHRFPMEKEEKSTLKRMLRYKKCERKYKKLAKQIGKADYVFASSTPPTMGLLAGKISKKMGAKMIYSLQDVFPDSLVSSGLIKKPKGIIWRLGRNIEKRTYKRADYITVISQNFYKNLTSKKVESDKLVFIPNWIDTDKVSPVDKEKNKLFEELCIDKNKFTIVYAGNMGAAQGADIILRVAERLKEQTDIQFVVFGGGAEYEEFVSEATRLELNNLIVNPLLPRERISEVYSLGDSSLIVCKEGVGKTALPSKTWSIMACDTPIIASFDLDSELAEIISESGAGVCVGAGDVEELSKAIIEIKNKPLKVSSRQYLEQNLSKEKLLKEYVKLFV